MKIKNLVLLGITILTFVFLIIAAFAFGFKVKGGNKVDLDDLKNATGYMKDTYGLMVSGLVFISITMIIAAVFVWMTSSKAQNQAANLKWMEISIYVLTALSVILVLAGEALLLSKGYNNAKKLNSDLKFGDVWDNGTVAGLFIFTLLPLPLLAIPSFIKK